jgi:hypothetical protein
MCEEMMLDQYFFHAKYERTVDSGELESMLLLEEKCWWEYAV